MTGPQHGERDSGTEPQLPLDGVGDRGDRGDRGDQRASSGHRHDGAHGHPSADDGAGGRTGRTGPAPVRHTTHGQGIPRADDANDAGGAGGDVTDPLSAADSTGHDDRDAGHTGHRMHEEGHAPDHGGHAGHGMGHGGHGDHVAMFRRLFWIMLALAVPTVLLSEMFASIVGYSLPDVPGLAAGAPVLGTVMYVWGGRPFLTGAVGEIRARKPGMMLLIGMAITVAFVASWGASLGVLSPELDFWWELALLIVIMLLGHWLEMRSLAQTSSALDSLAALLPDEAEKVVGDRLVTVPPAELAVGDVVIVRPGGRVPADGQVVDGTADVDESMIPGESKPIRRAVGDTVVAGTVATDTAIRVRVGAVGEDTALAGIQRLVAEAQSSSTRAQLLADRAAGWLFWFAVAAAAVTAVVWSVLGAPESALVRA